MYLSGLNAAVSDAEIAAFIEANKGNPNGQMIIASAMLKNGVTIADVNRATNYTTSEIADYLGPFVPRIQAQASAPPPPPPTPAPVPVGQVIANFVAANANNPKAIYETAAASGWSTAQLVTATGWPLATVNDVLTAGSKGVTNWTAYVSAKPTVPAPPPPPLPTPAPVTSVPAAGGRIWPTPSISSQLEQGFYNLVRAVIDAPGGAATIAQAMVDNRISLATAARITGFAPAEIAAYLPARPPTPTPGSAGAAGAAGGGGVAPGSSGGGLSTGTLLAIGAAALSLLGLG